VGGIFGVFFGLFLTLTLTVFAGVPTDSVLYDVLTAAGLVMGVGLGWWGPFGRRRRTGPPVTVPQPPRRPAKDGAADHGDGHGDGHGAEHGSEHDTEPRAEYWP
jgi:hypothetical protein